MKKNKKLRVLLTGGTGLVGNAILRELIVHDFPTLLLVRNPSHLLIPKDASCIETVPFLLEDITSKIAGQITAFRPEVVIHSAWIGTTNTDRNNPHYVLPKSQSSIRLFEIIKAAGCQQWIGLGSKPNTVRTLKPILPKICQRIRIVYMVRQSWQFATAYKHFVMQKTSILHG